MIKLSYTKYMTNDIENNIFNKKVKYKKNLYVNQYVE